MTSNKGFNGNEQVAIDAVLDAALDELGDDDSVSDESDIGDDNNGEIDADDNDDNDTTNFQDAQQEIIGETTLNNSSEDDSKSTGAVNPIVFGPEPPPRIEMPPGISPDDPEKFLARMMEEMMNGPDASGDDGAFLGNVFEQMKSQLEAEFGEVFPTNNKISTSTDTGRSTADKTTGNSISKESIKINKKKKQPSKTVSKNDVKKAIANLVEEIAKPATVVDDNDGAAIADDDDVGMAEELGMLNEILKGITSETGANNLDADSVVDGMMEQLLSKELMYEPMKQIALTFPTWLKENKESLSNDDYAERCKQCECFQKLVRVYEIEPNDTRKLMEYMQEVQEYGQPPVDIIKEIAPGLDLDGDGMPILEGTPWGVPGVGKSEECCMM